MQWFEIKDGQTLYIDEIDTAFKYIWIKWQRTRGGALSKEERGPLELHFVNRFITFRLVDDN